MGTLPHKLRQWIAALIASELFPKNNLQQISRGQLGDGGMSENCERMPLPATEPDGSEKWGDPPLWSPWNFHNPKPNREEQETSLRRRLRQLACAR